MMGHLTNLVDLVQKEESGWYGRDPRLIFGRYQPVEC